MKHFIIEGITGTGKSTMYEKVSQKMPSFKGGNLLFLNEYITWRSFERSKDIVQHCNETFERIIEFLDWLILNYNTAELQKTSRGNIEIPCCLMESFHWNAYARGIISKSAFDAIEEKLKALDFGIVLLVLSEEHIKSRSVVETRSYRTSGWSKYLETLGNTDDEISLYFKERQEKYYDIYSQSTLEKIIINTNEKAWDNYLEKILTWGEME